jgi:hypothetical protein
MDLLCRGIRAGRVPLTSMICPVGGTRWTPLVRVPQLEQLLSELAEKPGTSPRILWRRSHNWTSEFPLTYRELAFLVPKGTTPADAKRFLRGQLRLVQALLAEKPAGRKVSLAAFDAAFRGTPTGRPLATLTWKDWRESAEVNLTRRKRADTRGEEELLVGLFEAMNELHLCHDAVAGTEYCLRVGMSHLGAKAGLVHGFDVDAREFFVANALGSGAMESRSERYPESDPVLSLARRGEDAVVVQAAHTSAESLGRYRAAGGAGHVVAAPLFPAGLFVGAIEFVDPADPSISAANAVSYIARQLAEFIVSHGIVAVGASRPG